jgi:hypothetical protein
VTSGAKKTNNITLGEFSQGLTRYCLSANANRTKGNSNPKNRLAKANPEVFIDFTRNN